MLRSRLEFRRAGPSDAILVRGITRAAYQRWCDVIGCEPKPMTADYDDAVRHHMIDIASLDGEVLGVVEMIPRADDLLVENIAVAPEHQGKGFGHILIEHAESQTRKLGLSTVRLYTNKLFAANLRFYASLGYQIDGVEESKGGSIVHLSKGLGSTSIDRIHMEHAIRLGRRALGTTAENPPVGCVIVKNDRIVGVGWTRAGGRPHAETEALAMARSEARGATAYVTLEPCAHHGRTGPCAEALVRSGITRVVSALKDPDPRVRGEGHEILRRAGVEVSVGIGAPEARRDLAGFLTRIVQKRPQAILKMALSADGKIAQGAGQRTRITGDQVQARVHLLRAQCDGVLVGLETVLADDPELTCRLPGLERRSPIRIVADSRLSIPATSKLVRSAEQVPVWLLTARSGAVGPGVEVIECTPTPDGQVGPGDALSRLAQRGLNRILLEGGARIARSFLEADLVDRMELYRAPIELGSAGIDAFPGMDWPSIAARYELVGEERLGTDWLSVYERPGT